MLKELVDLLTCRELDADELASTVAAIEGAADDPDLDWLDDPSSQELMQTAIVFKLNDFTAVGDKIDEVHELIGEFFADPPLPDYPLHEDGRHVLPDEYFVWLDQRLLERAGELGGYELLLLGQHYSEDLHCILVLRKDTPRVLELARELALIIERATQRVMA